MEDKIKDLSMADLLALLKYFENKMKIETEREYYYYNMNSWKKVHQEFTQRRIILFGRCD